MQAVFPGRPQSRLQAFSTCTWQGKRIIELLQTINHNDDETLECVALDEGSGKLAVSNGKCIYIYKPVDPSFEALRSTYTPSSPSTHPLATLSWGLPEELLTSSDSLTLHSTSPVPRSLWSSRLASPAKWASFSHDASLIASTGQHDRLVKIWRRLFYGEDDERFDVSYLAHPRAVTQVRWRGRPRREQHADCVLYTTCADDVVRIWAPTDQHGLQALQLWGQLDMGAVAPTRAMGEADWAAVVIDSWDLETPEEDEEPVEFEEKYGAPTKARGGRDDSGTDVCLITDSRGTMSAWGLDRVGHKARQEQDIYLITVVESPVLKFPADLEPMDDHVQWHTFSSPDEPGTVHLLWHHFDGRAVWHTCSVAGLRRGTTESLALEGRGVWTGHEDVIEGISSSDDDDAFVTCGTETMVWTISRRLDRAPEWKTVFKSEEPFQYARVLSQTRRMVTVSAKGIYLWRTDGPRACIQATIDLETELSILAFDVLEDNSDEDGIFKVALVNAAGLLCVFAGNTSETAQSSLKRLTSHALGSRTPCKAYFCRDRADCVVATIDETGQIELSTLHKEGDGQTQNDDNSMTFATRTSEISQFCVSKSLHAAIVGRSGTSLEIWHLASAALELAIQFQDHAHIGAVACSISGELTIFAISFRQKIQFYAQTRHSSSVFPPWLLVKVISLGELASAPISSIAFLRDNSLAIASGTQLFIFDDKMESFEGMPHDIDVAAGVKERLSVQSTTARLNASVPTFHPQFLEQCIVMRRWSTLDEILGGLRDVMKYFSEGDAMSSKHHENGTNNLANGNSHSSSLDQGDDELTGLDEDAALTLKERIESTILPHLQPAEQARLTDHIMAIASLSKQRKSVDDAGLLFLTKLRLSAQSSPLPVLENPKLTWREYLWASHSTSQDILIDLSNRHYENKMSWSQARDCGIFMWTSEVTALRNQMTTVARTLYTSTSRDPTSCTPFYLALRQKPLLASLWRLASWHKESAATFRLLSNDFTQARWRSAALKNAYALLGRHRHEYAAAFFLLADDLNAAVDVLVRECGDVQLAIAVTRAYEGSDAQGNALPDGTIGPVTRRLLEEKVLPEAHRTGNRYQAAWAHSLLADMPEALQSLCTPLHLFVPAPVPPPPHTDPAQTPAPLLRLPSQSPSRPSEASQPHDPLQTTATYKSAMNTSNAAAFDAGLPAVYAHLRDRLLASPDRTKREGVLRHTIREEVEMVLGAARLLRRKGCLVLALELVREWTFTPADMFARGERDQRRGIANVAGVEGGFAGGADGGVMEAAADHEGEDEDTTEKQAATAAAAAQQEQERKREEEKQKQEQDEEEARRQLAEKQGRKVVVAEPSASSIFDSFDF
ncbi:hypothetical protein MRB53_039623 [Persea americana]|nr:hypothetical protein MRB53_039623 [Persea americana]